MKWKLIDSMFDQESGISTVIIDTDLGVFTGKSTLHEEDRDIKSIFQGCKYAEMRAMIKYGKEKIKLLKIKVKTLEEIINGMEKLNDYDKNCHEARYLRKQYYIKKDILEKWEQQIESVKVGLYNTMKNYREEQEKAIEHIQNKKSKASK